MIKLIICDIGGVIEDFSEQKYIDYICNRDRIDRREFSAVFMPILDKVEVGRETTSNMLGVLSRRFGIRKENLEFSTSFARLAKPNRDVIRLVNLLQKEIHCGTSHERVKEQVSGEYTGGFIQRCEAR